MTVYCRGGFHFKSEESSVIHIFSENSPSLEECNYWPAKNWWPDINSRQSVFCSVMAVEEIKFEGAAGSDWNASAADLDAEQRADLMAATAKAISVTTAAM